MSNPRILGPFDADPYNIQHAIRWADNYYGPDLSARFLDYLQSLDPDDQDRVADRGYPSVIADFEATL